MPSFKPKTNKTIQVCKKYNTTLDTKHTDFLKEFATDEEKLIPKLINERRKITQQINQLNEREIEERMELLDRIIEIKASIKELKQKKTNYFLNNSKYIFEYFEQKKNINSDDNINITTTSNNSSKNTKAQLLYSIFKIDRKPEPEQSNKEPLATSGILETTENLVHKYFSNIDESFIDMNLYVKQTDICQSCFKGELVPLDDEGVLICNLCAVSIPYLIENEKPSYKEPPKEVCFYAYKKINHFKEILSQFQGKETTQIHPYIIDQIKNQIKKERINVSNLTYNGMKDILKKLSFNKYYEHIAFIKNKLGIKPPIFSTELEETLCNLFMEIQSPYSKVCPDDRVNFLNYYYVLYKFLELLEERTHIHEIPMLKDREKLIEQDEIWKRICSILDWKFYATI